MNENKTFFVLLSVNFLLLLAQISTLSISYHEAAIIYGEPSFLKSTITFFIQYFGANDYALRLPMIFIHLFSTWLLYIIASYYVSKPYDKLWIVLIYMLLPGITSAALLINTAGFQIAFIFLFSVLYLRFGSYAYTLLPLFLLFPHTALFLYFIIALYSFIKREWITAAAVSVLMFFTGIYFGFNIGGVPEGRFLFTFFMFYIAVLCPRNAIYCGVLLRGCFLSL
jgi:hypothetical protein